MQDSLVGQMLYDVFVDLLSGTVKSYSFGHVRYAIEFETVFDHRDCLLFNEDRWNEATTTTQRNHMLTRAYLQSEKRLSGGCYMCGQDFANVPLRDMTGLDCHHVLEKKKNHNPSEGAGMLLDVARSEMRKCFPLCKCCHQRITYDEKSNDEFTAKWQKDGFRINMENGHIYKRKLRITICN